MSSQSQQKLDILTEIQVVGLFADLLSVVSRNIDTPQQDHSNIKDLVQRYKSATDKDQRAILVNTIVRELALHSEAEEGKL